MSVLRVLVADDHPVFRDGLATILQDAHDIEVVGIASNGQEAVDGVSQHKPDVVLMDLRMPVMDGAQATAQIHAQHADIAVLMLTMNNDDESILACLQAGAMGYLLKEATKDEIHQAIHTVAQGQSVFGAGITARVLQLLTASRARDHSGPFPQLSERERSVLELMSQGLDNASIARKLYVSDKTVRNNVSLVLTKLQVETRADAIEKAKSAGL